MSTTFTIDQTKAEAVILALSSSDSAKVAVKKAIAAVFFNNTGRDLTYGTVLASGKTEGAGTTIPPGYAAIVQPDGELHVLGDEKKVQKLYNIRVLNPFTVHDLAAARGLTIPTHDMVENALTHLREKNGRLSMRKLPLNWLQAQGKCVPFRVVVGLPKPQWGSTPHVAELDSVLVYETVIGGSYFISRTEFLNNWVLESTPALKGEELWQALPVLTADAFEAMRL